jgi:putative ABC transport system substrate-binding protein
MSKSANSLGIEIIEAMAEVPNDFVGAFTKLIEARTQALVVQGIFYPHRYAFLALAARHRLGIVTWDRLAIVDGGLMSLAASRAEIDTRTAAFIDKILKGAKPADLPVEQPTKFELVINLKTAKIPGLTVPEVLLVAADEVIE